MQAVDCFVTETGGGVVIHHADGLHEGIADGATHKAEPSFFEIFTHGIRNLCGGRDVLPLFPAILDGAILHELPDIPIKGSMFFLYCYESLGIGHGRGYFRNSLS